MKRTRVPECSDDERAAFREVVEYQTGERSFTRGEAALLDKAMDVAFRRLPDVYGVALAVVNAWHAMPHRKDGDCLLGPDDTCVVCGVTHVADCDGCGPSSHHAVGCEASDEREVERS